MKAPIKRSALRRLAGIVYYTLRRYAYWHLSKTAFATERETSLFTHEIMSHKTVLFRQLLNVDAEVQKNKIVNLSLALKELDGLIIEPGQTLSYWRQIGRPTKSKGYLQGMILNNGNVLSGTGGGLCQLSNLIYWISLHTPLTVVERWRHGYDVFPDVNRTQPFGSGATCSYPNIDLQLRNDTNQPFQLSLMLTDKHLVARWLSDKPINYTYKITEKNHEIEHSAWGGYIRKNQLFRLISEKDTGLCIDEELVVKNSAIMMYEPFLHGPQSK